MGYNYSLLLEADHLCLRNRRDIIRKKIPDLPAGRQASKEE